MFVKIVAGAVVLLTAIAAGAGSAWYRSGYAGYAPDFTNGAWEFYEGVGDPQASVRTRAFVARIAWFGLPASETIYAVARRDDNGETLDDGCAYRISGGEIDTRWWSVTAYRNLHWMPNPLNRYAYSSTTIDADARGGWSFVVSRDEQAGNWLPVDDAEGPLSLVVRLYNPSPALVGAIRTTGQLPRVEKLACG